MNFKICEGQLARFVELLAAYDFTIEFRPGISKKNAGSLSRRPCLDQLARTVRGLKRDIVILHLGWPPGI